MNELPTEDVVDDNELGVFIILLDVGRFLKGLLSNEVPVLSPIVPPNPVFVLLEPLLSWSIEEKDGLKELALPTPPTGGFMDEVIGGLYAAMPENTLPPMPVLSLSCLLSHVIICALLSRLF